jgi:hyperosmotically inducible periplasmic protein
MISNTTNTSSTRVLLLIGVMISAFVFAACGSSPHSRSTGRAVDDAWITSKVKSSLLADNLVSGTDVSVETYQGKVMLSGFVDAESQIDRAVEIAESTEGVQRVVNNLKLKSKQMGQRDSSGQMGGSGEMETQSSQERMR